MINLFEKIYLTNSKLLPVSTIMPYKDAEEAAALAKRGKGSLVGSIVSHDEKFVAETSWKMASSHGRILF